MSKNVVRFLQVLGILVAIALIVWRWGAFVDGLYRFYRAHAFLTHVFDLLGGFVTAIGGAIQVLLLIVGALLVLLAAWWLTGKAEQVLHRLWGVKRIGWLLAIVVAVVYYLTAVAIETAVLWIVVPTTPTWLAIGLVLLANAFTIGWHATHGAFWPVTPKWMLNVAEWTRVQSVNLWPRKAQIVSVATIYVGPGKASSGVKTTASGALIVRGLAKSGGNTFARIGKNQWINFVHLRWA